MLYFRFEPLHALWFLHVATFSMMPLLTLDHLVFPTIVLTFIYLMLVRITIRWITNDETSSPKLDVLSLSSISDNKLNVGFFYLSTIVGCSSLVIGQIFVQPPESLPFLFPLLTSAYSCGHFVAFFVYFNYQQIFGRVEIESGSFGKRKKIIENKNKKNIENKKDL